MDEIATVTFKEISTPTFYEIYLAASTRVRFVWGWDLR